MSQTPYQIVSEVAVQTAISASLKLYRQAAGLSMEQLARKAGCSKDTIFRIEDGRNSPKLATFYSLCVVLGVGPETLLGSPEDFVQKGAA